jgi:hypothetical protein
MPNIEGLVAAIRQRIDYEALFGEFVALRGSGAERRTFCLFHENTETPALSVNVEEGLYACHNPECGARGDFLDFYRRVRGGLGFLDAVRELAQRVHLSFDEWEANSRETRRQANEYPGSLEARSEALLATYTPPVAAAVPVSRASSTSASDPTVPEEVVASAHQRLIGSAAEMTFLEERRGLTRATVEQYELGYDGQRYYIPVRNEDGRCVNVRRYKPNARRVEDKMISWRTGFGRARLYPMVAFAQEGTIYVFEGELDAILARQGGLNAVTSTGGSGTWKEEWAAHFAGREVVICYDVDGPGETGARNVALMLLDTAESVKIVKLPISEPIGADYTDFIVQYGHTVEDFKRLVDGTTVFAPADTERERTVDLTDPNIPRIQLGAASRPEYFNVPAKWSAMVSGMTTTPYMLAKQVKMECGDHAGKYKMCDGCPLNRTVGAGSAIFDLDVDAVDLLNFIRVTSVVLEQNLKKEVGIPVRCTYVQSDVLATETVEELQVIPEIDESLDEATSVADSQYVTRLAYYRGHGLEANRTYLFTALTVVDPRTQMVVHVAEMAVPSQSNIDTFSMGPSVAERLEAFRPTDPGVNGLWEHLDRIYADMERRTRIYERRDVMLGVDLTFHSATQFAFQGELLVRGWVELLVIGDSRTGKTTIVQRMMHHYNAGEFSSGENTSVAGLVGGLHEVAGSWATRWGRIPLNDRRLLAIDEAGNLPTEQIGRMSSMRSSGVAEIVKIHTERTRARTRGIWISNPREPRPLSSYSQGVLAVKSLIGAPEDIARFDLVVTAATSDVALEIINAERIAELPQRFVSSLCHDRVLWVWSRRADQIQFQPGAERLLLRKALEQGQKYRYSSEIPLVEPNEQRVKLARLAVAAAALFFSSDESGERIIVEEEHVELAWAFTERIYAKPSLAFEEYSAMQTRRYELTDEPRVRGLLYRQAGAVRSMMEQEQFTQRDIGDILGIDDRAPLREAVATLRDAGFLRRMGSSFYVKTSGANAWLRRELAVAAGHSPGAMASFATEMVVVGEDAPW